MSNDSWRTKSSVPSQSDGWWQSLMAEEERYATGSKRRPRPHRGRKTRKAPNHMDWVDWNRVLEIQEAEALCYAEVVGYNRGGLLVRAQEFQGFVPRSHLVATTSGKKITERMLEGYMGEELELKVIECDPERGRIVLSERAAQSEPGSRQELLETLEIGQRVRGQVTNVTPFGLFIDLGGVEGLVHISELSWGRVGHPREVAAPGDRLEVVVLEIETDRGRVSLSLKRGLPNPWGEVRERYPVGSTAQAEITEVVHFGAFARLEEGLEGLIHISQMGLHERLDPRLVLEGGMQVQVKVLQIEVERQRLSLQLLDEPWAEEKAPSWLDPSEAND